MWSHGSTRPDVQKPPPAHSVRRARETAQDDFGREAADHRSTWQRRARRGDSRGGFVQAHDEAGRPPPCNFRHGTRRNRPPSLRPQTAPAAIDASAVVTAPASTNALTVDLTDI